MRYNNLIDQLAYWKEISGEDNPEVVMFDVERNIVWEIEEVSPSVGLEETKAIGLKYWR